MDDKTLMHYGVKGMHWGVRRYQPYPDGVTPRKKGDPPRKRGGKMEKPPSNKEIYKRSKSMSDEELQIANKRLQAENQYRMNMQNEKRAYRETSTGKTYAKQVLDQSSKQFISQLAVASAGVVGAMVGKAILNNIGNISMPQLLVYLSAR